MTYLRAKPNRWRVNRQARFITPVLLLCFMQSVLASLDYSIDSTKASQASEIDAQGNHIVANYVPPQGSASVVLSND